MNVYLQSDFHDYYDHMFDLDGEIYSRMSITTFTKALQFHNLNSMGLATPHRGLVEYMATFLPKDTMLVIYEKECSHRGEDKFLMPIDDAIHMGHGEKYSSVYLPNWDDVVYASSLRYLRIGSIVFWLKYESDDEWRSNCGYEVNISNVKAPDFLNEFEDFQPFPVFAVDFVECKYGGLLAVDYNTSPGLSGTPVQQHLSPTIVVQEIKTFMETKPVFNWE